jgi:hypothetical protein
VTEKQKTKVKERKSQMTMTSKSFTKYWQMSCRQDYSVIKEAGMKKRCASIMLPTLFCTQNAFTREYMRVVSDVLLNEELGLKYKVTSIWLSEP